MLSSIQTTKLLFANLETLTFTSDLESRCFEASDLAYLYKKRGNINALHPSFAFLTSFVVSQNELSHFPYGL